MDEYVGFTMEGMGARVYKDGRVMMGVKVVHEGDGQEEMSSEMEIVTTDKKAKEYCQRVLKLIEKLEKNP